MHFINYIFVTIWYHIYVELSFYGDDVLGDVKLKRTTRYNRKYVPSMDGLRALAVLVVIFYHLQFNWAKGGFIGVDIFFVISGYLITNILLTEWDNTKRINLKAFWIRRARRLIPAVYTMIIVVVVLTALFARPLLANLHGDAIAAFFYSSNWWFIFHHVSYFDSFGTPSLLKNLWSLAIEEQFYVFWPLILLIFLKWVKNPKLLLQIIAILSLISVILMGVLYSPGGDPSRVYYGTDTRAFDLLIGCGLAFIWPFNLLSPSIPKQSKLVLNVAGTISLLFFGIFTLFVSEYQPFLYRGGLLLVALMGGVMIASICHPASFLSKVFSFSPLRYIGKRSYGLYLWHYPIITLTTPVLEIGQPNVGRACLQILLTFIAAELSYQFIEMPIRKNGFIAYFKKFKTFHYFTYRDKPIGKWLAIGSVSLFTLIFLLGMTNLFIPKPEAANNQQTQVKVTSKPDKKADKPPKKQAPPKKNKSKKKAKPAKKKGKKDPGKKAGAIPYSQTLAIGDSIMIDIKSDLRDAVPNITIDGLVGRQLRDTIPLANSYQKFNNANSAVILELGTNGPFTKDQLNSLLSRFSRAHIFLITTRVPRNWEAEVNRYIESAASKKNVTVVDWYDQSLDNTHYFAKDGVHLTPQGSQIYVNLLTNQMKK